MQKILVLNSGSSSMKFQLLAMPSEKVIASGMVDRIGQEDALIKLKGESGQLTEKGDFKNHQIALNKVAQWLTEGVLNSPEEIAAIGHRVVHGGSHFKEPTLIRGAVKSKIKELFGLAPLHNPANLEGIEVAEKVFPTAIQVAVFDTAFHQSIPEKAYRYAIQKKMADEEGIRLYGFHGTSHQYVSRQATDHLKNPAAKMVILHLGNGCSATAVYNGQSVDHSLGFGPLSGLVMGSRSGDIDPSVLLYLLKKGYSEKELSDLLNRQSGMLGLTGESDLREIIRKNEAGDQECKLALELNTYRIKKYIGAYAAALNGLDALVFTAGIGENSALIRELVCREMEFLGIAIDPSKNEKGEIEIQADESKVKVLVIPTNEELEIARQTYQLI
ncbi:acetate/propionate family kinase [Jiulongibacter sediminis]|uniref:Acetate kinase n=1 Tax=Jiulongibacter sediminis TaxID=1605367 RepID=A0A0P7C2U5_9BACT|nr:acetate kinase [Jiulongibacter sediminis]KPM48459.1 acetate kinase [Jiulongibacter sediminis]TBX24997.1 acetate kinase [Jiulongibacter sediminis]